MRKFSFLFVLVFLMFSSFAFANEKKVIGVIILKEKTKEAQLIELQLKIAILKNDFVLSQKPDEELLVADEATEDLDNVLVVGSSYGHYYVLIRGGKTLDLLDPSTILEVKNLNNLEIDCDRFIKYVGSL